MAVFRRNLTSRNGSSSLHISWSFCGWCLASFLLGLATDRILSRNASPLLLQPLNNNNNNDNNIVTSSLEKSPVSLQEHHVMTWTIPQSIQTERHKECEGGAKISSTGGFCLTDKKYGYTYDTSLAHYLAQHVFADASVVDLGAGIGYYGKLLQEKPYGV